MISRKQNMNIFEMFTSFFDKNVLNKREKKEVTKNA